VSHAQDDQDPRRSPQGSRPPQDERGVGHDLDRPTAPDRAGVPGAAGGAEGGAAGEGEGAAGDDAADLIAHLDAKLSAALADVVRLKAELAAAEHTVDCCCGHSGTQHHEENGTGAARECLVDDCQCDQFSNVHMALTAAQYERDEARGKALEEAARVVEARATSAQVNADRRINRGFDDGLARQWESEAAMISGIAQAVRALAAPAAKGGA